MADAPRPLVLCGTWVTDRALADGLERRLGGRPVVCIDAPPMPDQVLLPRVPAWVDHHRRYLDAVEAPYLLAGFSFGGVVAIELARALASTREVAFVGIFDCIRPRIRPAQLREAVPNHIREAALLPDAAARRRYLHRELRTRVARRTPPPLLRARARLLGRDPGRKPAYAKPTSPLTRSIHRSYLHYEARPVTLPVHQYATRSSIERCHGDPTLLWAPFLWGGSTLQVVAGTHTSLHLEAHLDDLARQLGPDLDAIDPR